MTPRLIPLTAYTGRYIGLNNDRAGDTQYHLTDGTQWLNEPAKPIWFFRNAP